MTRRLLAGGALVVLLALLVLMTTLGAASDSFTGTGAGTEVTARPGDTIAYAVSGSFSATVVIEQFAGIYPNGTWSTVSGGTFAGTASFTNVASGTFTAESSGATPPRYRFRCSAFTSGTVSTTLTASALRGTAGTFVVQQPDSGLSNAQALSALATGVLKSTTTTGVVSTAVAQTDYLSPAFLAILAVVGTDGVGEHQLLVLKGGAVTDDGMADSKVNVSALTYVGYGGVITTVPAQTGLAVTNGQTVFVEADTPPGQTVTAGTPGSEDLRLATVAVSMGTVTPTSVRRMITIAAQ